MTTYSFWIYEHHALLDTQQVLLISYFIEIELYVEHETRHKLTGLNYIRSSYVHKYYIGTCDNGLSGFREGTRPPGAINVYQVAGRYNLFLSEVYHMLSTSQKVKARTMVDLHHSQVFGGDHWPWPCCD